MIENNKKQVDSNTRKLLWNRYFPKISEATCPVCGTRRISLIDGFEAAHIIPDGGENIDNLIPSCGECNNSSKQQNLLKYKYNIFPRDHSTISWMPSIKSLLDEIELKENKIKLLENELKIIKSQKNLVNSEIIDKKLTVQIKSSTPKEIQPKSNIEESKNILIFKEQKFEGKVTKIVLNIYNEIAKEQKEKFDKIKKFSFIKENKDGMDVARPITGTNFWLETRSNTLNKIIQLKKVMNLFGYSKENLKIIKLSGKYE